MDRVSGQRRSSRRQQGSQGRPGEARRAAEQQRTTVATAATNRTTTTTTSPHPRRSLRLRLRRRRQRCLQRIFAIASSACVAESYTSTRVQHAPRETCQPTDTLRSGPPPPLLLAPPRSPPHQRTPSNRDGHDRVEGGAYTHLRARPRTRVRLSGHRPPPAPLALFLFPPPLPPPPSLLVLTLPVTSFQRETRAHARGWRDRRAIFLPTTYVRFGSGRVFDTRILVYTEFVI